MENIYQERFKKLRDHMIKPQKELGHKRFDFGIYNIGGANTCGTAGCMAGELPIIFPKEWVFNWFGISLINLENNFSDNALKALMKFFGITNKETTHLFYPNNQSFNVDPNCKQLRSSATKEEVVENLTRFMKIKNIPL